MKRFTSLALALAALTTIAMARDANSDFKKFLVQLMPRLEKAFATKDASFFDKISTSDFTERMTRNPACVFKRKTADGRRLTQMGMRNLKRRDCVQ